MGLLELWRRVFPPPRTPLRNARIDALAKAHDERCWQAQHDAMWCEDRREQERLNERWDELLADRKRFRLRWCAHY